MILWWHVSVLQFYSSRRLIFELTRLILAHFVCRGTAGTQPSSAGPRAPASRRHCWNRYLCGVYSKCQCCTGVNGVWEEITVSCTHLGDPDIVEERTLFIWTFDQCECQECNGSYILTYISNQHICVLLAQCSAGNQSLTVTHDAVTNWNHCGWSITYA